MSAIIKLYDKNINSFKLNEQISFIGILEFNPPALKPEEDKKMQIPTDNQELDPNQMVESFFGGIPNEANMPQLHAITSRKMTVLQNPDLLKYCQVDKATLNEVFGQKEETAMLTSLKGELNQSCQKLMAIFKLIL